MALLWQERQEREQQEMVIRWRGYQADMTYLIARVMTGEAGMQLPTFQDSLKPRVEDHRTAEEIKNDILARL